MRIRDRVSTVQKLLKKANLAIEDIDLFEINEAFAAQSVACVKDLGIDPSKVNVNGGAIALGHPVGCTGARLIINIMNELERRGGKMCIRDRRRPCRRRMVHFPSPRALAKRT